MFLHTCPIFFKPYIYSMPKINFTTHENQSYTIEVQNGLTVMEGAIQNDIPGIDADCGGGMACATCHVYVNEEWLDKLPTKEDGEEDMLDMAYEPKQNSRLSCQLIVSDELDGLIVNIPSKQG
jgi:ferredoxin, 2Fe-2S